MVLQPCSEQTHRPYTFNDFNKHFKIILGRQPGVNRSSAAVLARNARVASAKPASGCAGLGYKGFLKCLSEAMKRI